MPDKDTSLRKKSKKSTSKSSRKSAKRKAATSRTAVVVLGMHRSGTSALAGALHLVGCDAPATPMKPTKANEKGYFESERICRLHADLLASAASTWDDWLPLNPGWFKSARGEEFHDRALDVLKEEFGGSRLFVLKDPRICRLVPFWKDVLKDSGVIPKYVLMHRNPIEVTDSLAGRDGMSRSNAILIWLRHVLDAEADTRGATRCFVNYESLLANWAGTMTKIQNHLDVPFPRLSVGIAPEVEAFLDLDLRHYMQKPDKTLDNPLLSEWVRDTYGILEKWATQGEDKADYATLVSIRHALTSAGMTFAPVIQESRDTAKALKERIIEVDDLQQELSDATQTREKLNISLEKAITSRNDLIDNRDAIRAERDDVKQSLKKALAEKTSLEISMSSIERERDMLKQSLTRETQTVKAERARFAEQQTALKELNSAFEKLEAERDAGQKSLDELKNDLSQAESALAQRSHEAEQTHRELQAIKAEQNDRDRRFVEMKTNLGHKEAALAQESNRINLLKRNVVEKSNEVAALEATVHTQTREIAELAAILREKEDGAQAEIADLKSRGSYAEAAYQSITNSTSWRITRPLRWLVEKFRN